MTKLSIAMSRLLRHPVYYPSIKRLYFDKHGFINLNTFKTSLSEYMGKEITKTQIYNEVKKDKKNRFIVRINNEEEEIAATHGHSIPGITCQDSQLLTPEELKKIRLVHGTSKKNIDLIQKNGLLKWRNYFHFYTTKSIHKEHFDRLIYLNVEKCLQDDMKFYLSSSGVVLTNGINNVIDPKYFEKIEYGRKKKLITKKSNNKDVTLGAFLLMLCGFTFILIPSLVLYLRFIDIIVKFIF